MTAEEKNWGHGPTSHDSQMWRHVKEKFGAKLLVDDVTDLIRFQTVIRQLKQCEAYDELMSLVKRRADQRDPHFSQTQCLKIWYAIESGIRSAFDKVSISTKRRKMFTVVVGQFALPLVSETDTPFTLFKANDVPRMRKLLGLKIAFKPKAVAALIPATEGKAIKRKRISKAHPGQGRRTDPTSTDPEILTASASEATIPDPEIEIISLPHAISRILNEGIWQLISHDVSVDEHSQVSCRLKDMIAAAFKLMLSEGTPLTMTTTDGDSTAVQTTIGNLHRLRSELHKHLIRFSTGYMMLNSLTPFAEPPQGQQEPETPSLGNSDLVPLPGPSPLHSPSPSVDDDEGQDGLYVLSSAEAMKLRKWVAVNRISYSPISLQPSYRCVQGQVAAHLAKASDDSANPIVDIVAIICTELNPAWVREVESMQQTNADAKIFFADDNEMAEFLRLRSSYILKLACEFSQFNYGTSKTLQDPEVQTRIAVVDCLIHQTADLQHFYEATLGWIHETPSCSMDQLMDFLLKIQELLGLVEEMPDSFHEVTDATESGPGSETPASSPVAAPEAAIQPASQLASQPASEAASAPGVAAASASAAAKEPQTEQSANGKTDSTEVVSQEAAAAATGTTVATGIPMTTAVDKWTRNIAGPRSGRSIRHCQLMIADYLSEQLNKDRMANIELRSIVNGDKDKIGAYAMPNLAKETTLTLSGEVVTEEPVCGYGYKIASLGTTDFFVDPSIPQVLRNTASNCTSH